jgi:hypothetical protein
MGSSSAPAMVTRPFTIRLSSVSISRNYLCNKHHEDFDELKSDLTAFFESKPVSFYRREIELLPEKWAKVVENNGDYNVD